MFKLKRIIIEKITISAIIILSLANCSKDQNSFLPYVKIDKFIPLANFNHLLIPGNSILFQDKGYRGLIVVCVNPDQNMYFAFDACCPYETDYSGIVEVKPIPGTFPPRTIFSSDYTAVCNKCGSEFSLLGSGLPLKGPATLYLKRYNVISGIGSLTVTN